jgi:hypothetical protein
MSGGLGRADSMSMAAARPRAAHDNGLILAFDQFAADAVLGDHGTDPR